MTQALGTSHKALKETNKHSIEILKILWVKTLGPIFYFRYLLAVFLYFVSYVFCAGCPVPGAF